MPSKPSRSARRTRSRSSCRWPAMSPGGCWPRTIRLSLHRAHSSAMPLSASSFLALVVLVERQAHAAQHVRRLGELDVGIFDDFEPVAPGVEEIEERPLDHARAGRLRQLDDRRAVVDDKADMARSTPLDRVIGHQRHVDELVAHVDEGVALALAAQGEVEDPPVPVERLVDVADLDRDMVDADEPRLLSFGHGSPHSAARLPRRPTGLRLATRCSQ